MTAPADALTDMLSAIEEALFDNAQSITCIETNMAHLIRDDVMAAIVKRRVGEIKDHSTRLAMVREFLLGKSATEGVAA